MNKDDVTLIITTVSGEEYSFRGQNAVDAYYDVRYCLTHNTFATKELKDSSNYVTRLVVSNIVSYLYNGN